MSEGSRASVTPGVRTLSPEVFLWAMGLFCGFIGAFVLIAPHRFNTPSYEALLPYAFGWGMLSLASGMAMLAVAVLRPRRALCFAAHLCVGATLLALAVSFFRVGATSGGVCYTVLGLGAFGAFLLRRDGPAGAGPGDLFGLLMGVNATLVGLLMLALPRLFQGSFYGQFPFGVTVFALAFLLTGVPLAAAQLAPAARQRWIWLVHVLAGATFLAFGLLISLPRASWTGVVLYVSGGAAVACLPWLRRRLAVVDTAALRARLSLTLVIATSLALILATAVVTAQEEHLAEAQVIATQRAEAHSVAQNVSDYIELKGARTANLATFAGREPMTAAPQAELLAGSLRVYPDLSALRAVSLDGRMVAAAGAIALPARDVLELAAAVVRDSRSQITPVRVGARSFFLLGAPIHDVNNDLTGTLVAAYGAEALANRISRRGANVSLNDGLGHTLAEANGLRPGETLPPLPPSWDRRVRDRQQRVEREEGLAGFAPVPRLNWAVAVESPRAASLAGVRRGRDLAFGLLLLVIPLTVTAGIFAARRIARPLGDLSTAVGELTAGNLAAPLGASSGIAEVARLAAAFQEMRDRLAERTGESERLATELRARAEALAETDRRKDEFLAMLAHELRNPLGAIANASYLLEQLGSTDPQTSRPVAIIRRQIQHLVRMVDDLLDVSRITQGKIELRRQPLDLAEVLRHAAEASRPLAEAKEQTLEVDLPPGSLPLDGDVTRLEQVVSNLLRNAVKFTEPRGHIALSVRREEEDAVVRVRDDGAGITAALLPRVFDLFTQGEQGLDRSEAGLGIGLTLVRSLVEMHGGKVAVRSEGPGKGSEFEVRLPLAAPAAVQLAGAG
ncbi:MAG TPA: sensor histidine kinase [Thermoanaerobaculia bacterium]|nr:sensor histidine kinase [Thermoanaerobaculia bacterium]